MYKLVFCVFVVAVFVVATAATGFAGEMASFGKVNGDEIDWWFQIDIDSIPESEWGHYIVEGHNIWLSIDPNSELDDPQFEEGHCYCFFVVIPFGLIAWMDCEMDDPCEGGCYFRYNNNIWYTTCVPYYS